MNYNLKLNNKDIDNEINNKNILITGGTGSFGKQILNKLLEFNPNEICIFSRDENKQYDMRDSYKNYKNINFQIGDIRNLQRVKEVSKNKDIIFHAAALKQVPNCEEIPYEAVLTNIVGAENIKIASLENNVQSVISISTDKAVKPVNVMGMTKAIQERIFLNSKQNFNTKFVCVRYGNILGSRGSILHLFYKYINENKPIPITDMEMTRFQLTLKEAINLVILSLIKGSNGDLFVKKMRSSKVYDFARVFSTEITNNEKYPLETIGIRPGEKIHEILISEEEINRTIEFDNYFIIKNYNIENKKHNTLEKEYSSNNKNLLSYNEIKNILIEDNWLLENGNIGKKLS